MSDVRGIRGLFVGVRYLGRGVWWVARRPRQWVFGMVPALIVLVFYAAALVWLAGRADELAVWVTPFADSWEEQWRTVARVIAGVAILVAGGLVAVLTFTAATLLVGEPFYERISERVEESCGGAPEEPDVPWTVKIGRAVRDSLILGAVAVAFAVTFFALGFVPVLGQFVVPVVAAVVSGWFLAGELTSVALERRGLVRRERFALMRRERPVVVGFGAATFVTFLIPLGAVLVMPGAVAGGTLLARERLAPGEPEEPGEPAEDRPVTKGDVSAQGEH
ncbi:EI24 domain-containing protein [Thermomonospora cellulosilytica]|uniref:CysZ protein n=1 Tax=Thermomonospora cellulosilytica TaxID=1411118 RepID=A0A7W3RBX0_9ACTN|nr:EI24 domain-containing protein [Thermomonospora cellulosilytica]MBA9007843.1 CysZ protein [Thermomonospora cellulosilytica]